MKFVLALLVVTSFSAIVKADSVPADRYFGHENCLQANYRVDGDKVFLFLGRRADGQFCRPNKFIGATYILSLQKQSQSKIRGIGKLYVSGNHASPLGVEITFGECFGARCETLVIKAAYPAGSEFSVSGNVFNQIIFEAVQEIPSMKGSEI
jgi:hypothetical protein